MENPMDVTSTRESLQVWRGRPGIAAGVVDPEAAWKIRSGEYGVAPFLEPSIKSHKSFKTQMDIEHLWGELVAKMVNWCQLSCFIQLLLLILRGFFVLRPALEPWTLHQALFHFGFRGEKGTGCGAQCIWMRFEDVWHILTTLVDTCCWRSKRTWGDLDTSTTDGAFSFAWYLIKAVIPYLPDCGRLVNDRA